MNKVKYFLHPKSALIIKLEQARQWSLSTGKANGTECGILTNPHLHRNLIYDTIAIIDQ